MRGSGFFASWRLIAASAALFCVTSNAMAQQWDFFTHRPERNAFARAMPSGTDSGSLFGNTVNYGTAPVPIFGDEPAARLRVYRRGRQQKPHQEQTAFCVRTCDGRYFPASMVGGQSHAETCKNFCPASETKLFHGANIDEATGENHEPYSKLPNAFRYRKEIVAGCTCDGQSEIGLSRIPVEEDPTLRKGDIVALAKGLMMVSGRSNSKSMMYNFTPAPRSIVAQFERKPQLATR